MNSTKKQILFYFIFANFLYSQNHNQKNNSNDSLILFERLQNENLNIKHSEKVEKITTIYNYVRHSNIFNMLIFYLLVKVKKLIV